MHRTKVYNSFFDAAETCGMFTAGPRNIRLPTLEAPEVLRP